MGIKIAFLGKGGSGKSTLATAYVGHMLDHGHRVLAIDADHNMDLTYLLGLEHPTVFLGTDPSLIKQHVGATESMSFLEARDHASKQGVTFSIDPMDSFTSATTTRLTDNLLLMVAGPHTDQVRGGKNCSHSLAAPLKVYVPLLRLAEHEVAVIDERAGTDPVATGILSDISLAVIVVEPSVQSVRVARQIADELTLAHVPYVFVANKVDDDASLLLQLPQTPIASIPFGKTIDMRDAACMITDTARR
ncbi:hypothetical protein FJY93_03765 [Candidatus Kaiserbacteria bacterium]|nr:hypothetical protein [Candidatus Kaiserbacteria bacterium]